MKITKQKESHPYRMLAYGAFIAPVLAAVGFNYFGEEYIAKVLSLSSLVLATGIILGQEAKSMMPIRVPAKAPAPKAK